MPVLWIAQRLLAVPDAFKVDEFHIAPAAGGLCEVRREPGSAEEEELRGRGRWGRSLPRLGGLRLTQPWLDAPRIALAPGRPTPAVKKRFSLHW